VTPVTSSNLRNQPPLFTELRLLQGTVKSAMQNYFHNFQVPCYSCVTWYETRTTFFTSLFSLEVKLLWRNAFACGKGLGR